MGIEIAKELKVHEQKAFERCNKKLEIFLIPDIQSFLMPSFLHPKNLSKYLIFLFILAT